MPSKKPMPDPLNKPDKSLKKLRWAALISYLCLILWVVIWHGFFEIQDGAIPSTQAWLLFAWVMPLLLPLKGIIQAKAYTHVWACFILLIYFLHSVTLIFSDLLLVKTIQLNIYALIEFILTSLSFIFCCFYGRKKAKSQGSGLAKLSQIEKAERAKYQG